jgi:hypothetical protein
MSRCTGLTVVGAVDDANRCGVYWEPTEDGLVRCNRHPNAQPWSPGTEHSCEDCKTDPGNAELDVEDLAAPSQAPKGCLTSVQLEETLVENAKAIEKAARGLLKGKGKGRINYATAFVGMDTALKFWRAAIAMCGERERREYVARLERLQRSRNRKRRGGHN